ncbi:hypothetical protein Agub_g5339, partial [Astrephomene gubernaculifera]
LAPAELVAVPDPAAADTPTAKSRLLVGPRDNLPGLLNFGWRVGWGQYWVVAVMPSNDSKLGYDWAIVSGGAPEFATAKGCVNDAPPLIDTGLNFASSFFSWVNFNIRTKAQRVASITGGSSSGLWFLSRQPVDPQATKEMERTARDLGFDTSVMVDVEQEGCKYGGAPSPLEE